MTTTNHSIRARSGELLTLILLAVLGLGVLALRAIGSRAARVGVDLEELIRIAAHGSAPTPSRRSLGPLARRPAPLAPEAFRSFWADLAARRGWLS